jgi:hypothetical protein
VLQALARCRTEALGGYVATCDTCDYRRIVYNPCRDRHCPACEGHAAQEWLADLRRRILPCRYFHVVFTVPAELRWLAFQNGALVYDLMLRAAGETLLEAGQQPKFLGAQLGITVVLHTWKRDLQLHPHVHCLVTAGGLTAAGDQWIPSYGEHYLFPNDLLAARFRAKILGRLAKAHRAGALRFASGCADLASPEQFATARSRLETKSWLVYSKAAFKDLDHLLRYLGRYTHRVGISDRRILEATDDSITFATKNGGTANLLPFDFISRFLLHVLPRGFVKIRHYGLFSAPARKRREIARGILGLAESPVAPAQDDPLDPVDPVEPASLPCPQCFFGHLELEPLPHARPPPVRR